MRRERERETENSVEILISCLFFFFSFSLTLIDSLDTLAVSESRECDFYTLGTQMYNLTHARS